MQYPESTIKTLADLKNIPLRSANGDNTALLDAVAKVNRVGTPTEVDHYQLRRVIDVFVAPKGEAIGGVANQMDRIIADIHPPAGVRVTMRGTVQAMRASFQSFGLGLILAVVLVYLILVAQFRSFIDPFLILLAVPPGITGVLLILSLSGTTLNIMSLIGVVMMVGIVTSNSILIVEFTHRLIEDGMSVREAVMVAALHPDRVSRLVSCGSGYNLQNSDTALKPAALESERAHWYWFYLNSERGETALSPGSRRLLPVPLEHLLADLALRRRHFCPDSRLLRQHGLCRGRAALLSLPDRSRA